MDDYCLVRRVGRGMRLGFTLVEILVVVVILGILAAIVVASVRDATETTRQTAFASNIKLYNDAVTMFITETGMYPGDSSSGDCPAGFEEFLDCEEWERGTPIGGVWDVEFQDTAGVTCAFGVHFDGTGMTRDDAYMLVIDGMLDDGDLETGAFQRIAADRYYYIVAW